MGTRARTFICEWCHAQVFICTHLDYRNKYCGSSCSKMARQKYLRMAGKKYQNSRKGKFKHAARQKRYRERQKQVKRS